MTSLVLIVLLPIFIALAYFFLIPFLFGAPYDPSRGDSLRNIVKLAKPRSGDKIAELGAGDGRVCIALAEKIPSNKKIEIHGFEINLLLVWIARRRVRRAGLESKIKIYWKNFWKVNFKSYNKAVMFQFSTVVGRISKKLRNEMKPGSKIISHNWKIPKGKLKKQLGKQKLTLGKVYLYEV